MKIKIFIIATIIIFAYSCHSQQPADQAFAVRLITKEQSGTQWKTEKLVRADLDDDGIMDFAIYGIKNKIQVCVAVVLSPVQEKSKVHILEFGVGNCQDCVSKLPIDMVKESLDYDPKEAIEGDLPGFRQSKTAHGLELNDRETDPIHVFWNHQSKTLDWWRL